MLTKLGKEVPEGLVKRIDELEQKAAKAQAEEEQARQQTSETTQPTTNSTVELIQDVEVK